jgi:hypothetical protein
MDTVPDRATLLEAVKNLLPPPLNKFICPDDEHQADRATILIGGWPQEVVVRITDSIVSVAVFAARWSGPHTLKVAPEKLASFKWRRMPLTTTLEAVGMMIERFAMRGIGSVNAVARLCRRRPCTTE